MSAAGRLTVGGLHEHSREFFTGRPVWRVDGVNLVNHPEGYERSADAVTGALIWTHEDFPGDAVVETGHFWGDGEASLNQR